MKMKEAPQIPASARSRATSWVRKRQRPRADAARNDPDGSASPDRTCFTVEQRRLARHAPTIARERAPLRDDAMTRNRERGRIGRDGACDCTNRAGRPDRRRNFAVRCACARSDAPKLLPHAVLEGGAADVERERKASRRMVEIGEHVRDVGRKIRIGVHSPRGRESRSQIAFQCRARIAELDGADTALGCGNEKPAQLCSRHCIADCLRVATTAKGAGGHPERLALALVDARRRSEAGVRDRGRDVAARREPVTERTKPVCLGVRPRRDSDHALERPVEMRGTVSRGARELVEARRPAVHRVAKAATGIGHRRGEWTFVASTTRVATPTGAKSRLFGFIARREKADVGALGAARRT